jgi:hypothetical protein
MRKLMTRPILAALAVVLLGCFLATAADAQQTTTCQTSAGITTCTTTPDPRETRCRKAIQFCRDTGAADPGSLCLDMARRYNCQ